MIKSDALDKRLYTVAKHSKTSGKNCEENHCRQVKDVKIDDFVEFSKCVLHCWTDRAMGMSPTDDDTRDTCDTCFEFMASVCRIDGSAACTNVLSCDVVCCKCKKGHLVSVCARVKFLYHYSLFLKDDWRRLQSQWWSLSHWTSLDFEANSNGPIECQPLMKGSLNVDMWPIHNIPRQSQGLTHCLVEGCRRL